MTETQAPAPSEPAPPDPAPPPSDRVPVPLAVAIVIAAVLASLVVVGSAVQLSQQRLPTGPPRDPPSPTAPATGVRLGPGPLDASVGQLVVTLPDAPYVCQSYPPKLPPTFPNTATCGVAVHPNYNGKNDWYANAGLAQIPPALTVPGDPVATGEQVLESFAAQFYRGQRPTWENRSSRPYATPSVPEATLLTGELHIRVAKLPTRYDQVELVLVALSEDRYAAYFAGTPNDAPAAVRTALDASLASLRVA